MKDALKHRSDIPLKHKAPHRHFKPDATRWMNISQCKPPKHTHKEQPPVEKRHGRGFQNTREFYMLARCCYLQLKITEDALLIQVQTSYWMVRWRRAYRSATTKCLFPVEEDVRNAYAGYSSNNTQTVIFISYTTFIPVGWMLSPPPTPARSKPQWSPWESLTKPSCQLVFILYAKTQPRYCPEHCCMLRRSTLLHTCLIALLETY